MIDRANLCGHGGSSFSAYLIEARGAGFQPAFEVSGQVSVLRPQARDNEASRSEGREDAEGCRLARRQALLPK